MCIHHGFVLLRHSFASNNGWQVSVPFTVFNGKQRYEMKNVPKDWLRSGSMKLGPGNDIMSKIFKSGRSKWVVPNVKSHTFSCCLVVWENSKTKIWAFFCQDRVYSNGRALQCAADVQCTMYIVYVYAYMYTLHVHDVHCMHHFMYTCTCSYTQQCNCGWFSSLSRGNDDLLGGAGAQTLVRREVMTLPYM